MHRPRLPARSRTGPVPASRSIRVALAGATAAAALGSTLAAADLGSVHAVRTPDGTMSFSDVAPSPGAAVRTSYAGRYGRPPATASCRGLDAPALDALGEAVRGDVEAAARSHGLDPALAMAVVRVESCFDAGARSVAGADGLMQLMPATAAALGVTDVHDARANLDGGSRYLARLLRRYGGDETLALAAYNAGPGNVDRHGGVPPFPETVRYVRRVRAERARYARGTGRS